MTHEVDNHSRERAIARCNPCTLAEVKALVRSLRGVDYLFKPRMPEEKALDLIERYGVDATWKVAVVLKGQK